MRREAVTYTVKQVAELGRDNIPPELLSGQGLVYSSPATLAYNSPGAEGFGVKRAGLSVPESVMLIVSPGCCGRNTSIVSSMPEYEDRFFRNRMCYGDAEHYDRRIENLVKNDGYIPYKKIRIDIKGSIMHIALMIQKDRVEAGSMICNEYLSRETRKCAVVYLE